VQAHFARVLTLAASSLTIYQLLKCLRVAAGGAACGTLPCVLGRYVRVHLTHVRCDTYRHTETTINVAAKPININTWADHLHDLLAANKAALQKAMQSHDVADWDEATATGRAIVEFHERYREEGMSAVELASRVTVDQNARQNSS
jgi:hypothetical protein